jgi:hypothetical protein
MELTNPFKRTTRQVAPPCQHDYGPWMRKAGDSSYKLSELPDRMKTKAGWDPNVPYYDWYRECSKCGCDYAMWDDELHSHLADDYYPTWN